MKKIFLLFIITFFSLYAQGEFFEGKLLGTYKSQGIEYSVKILLKKDGKMFSELKGSYQDSQGNLQNVAFQQIFQKDKVYLVYNSPEGKVYSEITPGSLNPLPGPFTLASQRKIQGEFAGFKNLVEYTIHNADKEIVYLVSEELKFPISKYKNITEDFILKGLSANHLEYYPLKVHVKNKQDGTEIMSFEITTAEARNVPENIFEIPADAIKKDFIQDLD